MSAVQLENGKWRCSRCGALLSIPLDASPKVVFSALGGTANYRSIMLHGEEIHRCVVDREDDTSPQGD